MKFNEFAINLDKLQDNKFQLNDRLIAKMISAVEENGMDFSDLLENVYLSKFPTGSLGKVLGVTGPPGVGKSTFVNNLISRFSTIGLTVAVLAFDPSSRKTGGAFLGDRIRCSESLRESSAYFRSMSNKGTYGGLSLACLSAIRILTLGKFDVIIVETVGVGQNEVDIAEVATKVVYMLDSGSGDSIQTEKVGIMEIADLYILNKSDLYSNTNLEMALNDAVLGHHKNPTKAPRVLSMNFKATETIDAAFFEIRSLLQL